MFNSSVRILKFVMYQQTRRRGRPKNEFNNYSDEMHNQVFRNSNEQELDICELKREIQEMRDIKKNLKLINIYGSISGRLALITSKFYFNRLL